MRIWDKWNGNFKEYKELENGDGPAALHFLKKYREKLQWIFNI